ncbi:MAG TPA: NAD(P)-binding domain-containing protein [Longimicrobiales bacterium]|nr:NAD(P)-binding domain-containing protein [Longimicrobiales bacterium]
MRSARVSERIHTVVIGGGQAGLSVGYHLARRRVPFVILDASERIGDSWRARWDSLHLFTPACFDGLDGMTFPAAPWSFPTKDAMADYLEAYAAEFDLPVRTGVRVDGLKRVGGRFRVSAGDVVIEADNVVVAMANFQKPRVPSFARDLDPSIVQLHSSEYRSPAQLRDGPVLVVGAGNSGAEIAIEVARTHTTTLAGRDTGQVPFRIDSRAARFLLPVVFRLLFHRVLSVATPVGRRVRRKVIAVGGPLIRVKGSDLAAAGVERLPKVTNVRGGLPVAGDAVIDAANIIWCTGFHPGFEWIDIPVHGDIEPRHHRGVAADVPGLYFVGLHFLSAMSSVMIHGVGRDADRIAKRIAGRPNSVTGRPRPARVAVGAGR